MGFSRKHEIPKELVLPFVNLLLPLSRWKNAKSLGEFCFWSSWLSYFAWLDSDLWLTVPCFTETQHG